VITQDNVVSLQDFENWDDFYQNELIELQKSLEDSVSFLSKCFYYVSHQILSIFIFIIELVIYSVILSCDKINIY